jgi:hypothetical protein
MDLGKLDQPIVFAISIIFVVVGGIALFSWGFKSLGWTGPLGLFKGGVSDTAGVAPPS